MFRFLPLALLAALAWRGPARAHDGTVPKNNHDRHLAITLTATGAVVDYQLEVARGLDAPLDDRPLTFTVVARRVESRAAIRCDFRFHAAWQLQPGRKHAFSFREGNFEGDRVSVLDLSLHA